MVRVLTRYLLGAVLFLGSTLVFWGLIQTHSGDLGSAYLDIQNAAIDLERNPPQTETPAPKVYTPMPQPFQFIPRGVRNYLRAPKTNRIWPLGSVEDQDRIMAQVNTVPKNPKLEDKEEEKMILIYNGFPEGIPEGRKKFETDNCPVTNCWLTEKRDKIREANAVVIQSGMYQVPPGPRNPEQIWILYVLESPENIIDLSNAEGMFNWTATYRLDSTINTPYERFVPFSKTPDNLPMPKRNYAEGKTKKVAWFVSNCYAINGRLEYAKALQKHIDVDIYGECGTKLCARSNKKQCFGLLSKDYKFYLAFENSNCKDYITEKFYWNGLYNDVVPIVMGARPQDYAAVAPPHSYIHVDDFESPAHLAEYLYTLDENDKLYNEFFKWKGTGEFIDTKYWCRLCSLVHEAQNNALSPSQKFSVWYGDIQKWWNGPGICVHPKDTETPWATWRNVTTKLKPEDTSVMYYGSWPRS